MMVGRCVQLAAAALMLCSGQLLAQDQAQEQVPAQTNAQAPATFAEALSAGIAKFDFRYRYEFVDQDGFLDEANASTAQLRLSYQTGSFNKWSAFGEFDYIGEVVSNYYNSLGGSSPERNRYPVVADPKGADLNQLYVAYQPNQDLSIRLGRQRILLDNQRFVGNVGWRQNEQTFDAANVAWQARGNTAVNYSYITAEQRIFGRDVAAGRHDTDTHLLNVAVTLSDDWRVSPYYYRIDNDDAPALSTGTLGARLSGNIAAADNKVAVMLEYAKQTDVADNPANFDADYFNATTTLTLPSGLSLGLGYESLGGDANATDAAFRTPLATLHAFQGWADKFLATPPQGINDASVTVKYKAGKWSLTGSYHDFSAEAGPGDWGSELDISAARALGEGYNLLIKSAFYEADEWATDTTKFWVMLTGGFSSR